MTKIRKKIGNIPINTIKQDLQDTVDASVSQMQQDVTDFIDEETSQYPEIGGAFKFQEDPEGRSEITTDSEGKIISYRDSDGVKHEEVGIKSKSVTTNSLTLSSEGMTEFQQALKDAGFKPGGHGDWSEYLSNDGDNPLILPSPKCAKVNIILPNRDLIYNLLKEGVPGAVEGVNYNVPSSIEYYDNFGNYFKKPILISAQGQSTLLQRKRNLSIDLFDSSVYNSKGKLGKGDAFKVKIGEWVSQDSFHLKGFYTDILRCRSIATYRVYKDICRSRGIYNEYIWKKGLLNAANIPYRWQELPDNDDFADYLNDELDTGATCIPDGFPIILYVNGELFGCYSWQLKKHRDNYKLNKSDSNHVWIDSSASDIWNMNGNLDWSILKNIEVRNPKDLYVKNDNGDIVKYNVDDSNSIGEFIDSTMEGYDPTNKDHVRTDEVKTVLSNMSTILPRLVAAEKPCIIAATNSTYWEYIGTMYEVTGVTYDSYSYVKSDYAAGDYVIFHNHIFCAKSSMPATTLPIDLNASHDPTDAQVVKDLFETYFDVENLIDYQIISQFVLHWDNWGNNWQWITYDGIKWYCSLYDCDQVMVQSPSISLVGKYMFCVLIHFYKKELDDRYEELKDLNILSKENLIRHIESYIHAWGEEYYKYDVETHGYTRRDTTLRIAKWIDENIRVMNTLYV